jgi:hypothetical protein
MKKLHPEQQDGELYMGNATEEQYPRFRWRTKRRGETSHDGNEFPWFIAAAEVRERIASSVRAPNSAERIAVYRAMLVDGGAL